MTTQQEWQNWINSQPCVCGLVPLPPNYLNQMCTSPNCKSRKPKTEQEEMLDMYLKLRFNVKS